MGNSYANVFKKLFKRREVRIIFIGLDAAGKTTTLYNLKLGELVVTIPTIGFNVETIEHKGLSLTTWDVGGRGGTRLLWRHYMENMDGLILMVDSNDRERIADVQTELQKVIDHTTSQPQPQRVPVLIFANKQDLPNALSVREVEEALDCGKICGAKTPYRVFPSVASSGVGLREGLDWLCDAIVNDVASQKAAEIAAEAVKPVQHTFASLQGTVASLFQSVSKLLSSSTAQE